MASRSTRTWVIEQAVEYDEDGDAMLAGHYDRSEALAHLQDLEAVLFTVGGMVSIAADRVKVGEAPGGEALAVSRRLIIEWQAFAPMRDEGVKLTDDGSDPTPEELEAALDAEVEREPLAVGADVEWDEE